MTLELEWQKAEQERQEDTHQHEPPEVEFGFYNQVQQGDVDAVQENLRSGLYRQIAMRVRLSDDLVQNFRYHCIVCLSMVSRFCIEGGMPGEQAYRMSDFYIRKIDTATTIDQVENCMMPLVWIMSSECSSGKSSRSVPSRFHCA